MYTCLAPGAIGIRASLEEGLAIAAEAGFKGLDVGIKDIADRIQEEDADQVKGLFSAAGVRPGAWGLPVAWNGSDPDYEETLKELAGLAAAGASIGATRCAQWIPATSDERSFRENFRWHVRRLKPICEILADAGCSLGLEFIGPRTMRVDKAYGFIYSLEGMLGLCEAIGTGNAGLLLDCWHWYTSLGTVADLKALVVEDVVTVHVNDAPMGVLIEDQVDNRRALPSETGVIDLASFLNVLKDLDYKGPVTPEPFSQRVRELPPAEAARETFLGLDKAWREAGIA